MLQCYVQTPVLLYLIGAMVLIALLVYLARFGNRSATIAWFRIFLGLSIFYNFVASWLRCPFGSGDFAVVVDLYGLMGSIMFPVVIIFALHFMSKEHLLTRFWVRFGLFLSSFFALFLSWRDELVVSHDIAQTTMAFGYRSLILGPHSGMVGTVELIGYILPIILIGLYYRHLDDPIKRREVGLVNLALIIIIVPSIILEGFVQSALHVTVFPVGPFTTVIACSLMTYALTKYGLRVFSLSNVSSNLMQVMPGGLIVLDHTSTIQYVNGGAAAMLGYETRELAGTSIKKLLPDAKVYTRFQSLVLAASDAKGQIAGQEILLQNHQGKALAVSLNAVSVFSGRELINRLISFTDITPLKQAQAALQAEKAGVELKVVERTHELAAAQAKLKASIESLPLGYIMIDDKCQVAAVNPSAGRILRYTGHQPSIALLTKKLGGFDLRGLVEQCLVEHHTAEVKELAIDGRYVHLFAAPIVGEEGAIIGAVMLVEDITEEKVLERSKDEFFSIASHELRTPLTSIRGNSSMMMDYYKEALKDPSLQDMVHDVHESSTRLIGIVNDFLDMSRLEQGKVTFKFADMTLAPQIEGVAGELENEAKLKHTVIKFNASALGNLPHVIGDADRLKQVAFNLLGNALKFTENGTISMQAEADHDFVTVSVTDTGRGIPEASQKLLFHKFQQGGASLLTRDTAKGTGLGLYISRLMVEGMGGKLWLERSEPGNGSTFAFTVPVATPQRLADLAKLLLDAQTTDTTTGLTTPVKEAK